MALFDFERSRSPGPGGALARLSPPLPLRRDSPCARRIIMGPDRLPAGRARSRVPAAGAVYDILIKQGPSRIP